jgi:hypothetical protein
MDLEGAVRQGGSFFMPEKFLPFLGKLWYTDCNFSIGKGGFA